MYWLRYPGRGKTCPLCTLLKATLGSIQASIRRVPAAFPPSTDKGVEVTTHMKLVPGHGSRGPIQPPPPNQALMGEWLSN